MDKPQTLQEFYTRPARWVRGMAALDKHGASVDDRSSEATAFCLSAAIGFVYDGQSSEILLRVKAWIKENTGLDDIPSWNDKEERSFKDIRRLVKELNI